MFIHFPNFLPKDGLFVVLFTNQTAKIKEDGEIQLKRDLFIHIPELVDTAMDEEERVPLIRGGRPIKSINQFYNKKRAEIQSMLSKIGEKFSHSLIHLTDWRNEKISDYMHKASHFVINHCLDNNIGHIVIGKNSGWKQCVNIGKPNNQNFVSIPFDKLIRQIQYKAQLVGIKVTITHKSNNNRRKLYKQVFCS